MNDDEKAINEDSIDETGVRLRLETFLERNKGIFVILAILYLLNAIHIYTLFYSFAFINSPPFIQGSIFVLLSIGIFFVSEQARGDARTIAKFTALLLFLLGVFELMLAGGG